VFVAEVGVDGGAADAGAVEPPQRASSLGTPVERVPDGDGVEGPGLYGVDEGVAEGVAGAADAGVDFVRGGWGLGPWQTV